MSVWPTEKLMLLQNAADVPALDWTALVLLLVPLAKDAEPRVLDAALSNCTAALEDELEDEDEDEEAEDDSEDDAEDKASDEDDRTDCQ